MARQPTGNPNGRPPKEIDWDQFEQLCKIQCTHSEIESVLGISRSTLDRHVKDRYGETFEQVYKVFSEDGKSSLRRAQFKTAMGGNVAMLIWLGKIVLGQRDSSQEEVKKYAQGIYENITTLIRKNGESDAVQQTGTESS